MPHKAKVYLLSLRITYSRQKALYQLYYITNYMANAGFLLHSYQPPVISIKEKVASDVNKYTYQVFE